MRYSEDSRQSTSIVRVPLNEKRIILPVPLALSRRRAAAEPRGRDEREMEARILNGGAIQGDALCSRHVIVSVMDSSFSCGNCYFKYKFNG